MDMSPESFGHVISDRSLRRGIGRTRGRGRKPLSSQPPPRDRQNTKAVLISPQIRTLFSKFTRADVLKRRAEQVGGLWKCMYTHITKNKEINSKKNTESSRFYISKILFFYVRGHMFIIFGFWICKYTCMARDCMFWLKPLRAVMGGVCIV